jgi:hypothetical protein
VGYTFPTWDIVSTTRWTGSGVGQDCKSGFNGVNEVYERETGQYGSDDEVHRRGREWEWEREREVGQGGSGRGGSRSRSRSRNNQVESRGRDG